MSSEPFGTILYVTSGKPVIFIKSKSNGIWGSWSQIATNDDLTTTRTAASYNIPAAGKQELQISVAKSSHTSLAIAGFYGLKEQLYLRQFWLEGDAANIHIHNPSNTAISGTIQVFVLYKPS